MAASRCKTCASGGTHTFEHGYTGYTRHRCRCPECVAANRAYAQKYYYANRAALRAYQNEYYHEHKEEMARRRELPERRARVRAYNKEYYAEHVEEILQWHRDRNPVELREKTARYRRENEDYCRWASAKGKRRLTKDIPTPRHRSPWTPVEDSIVMSSRSLLEMCYILGRSYSAVSHQRAKLRSQLNT
jgi:hypothetical protein